MLSPPVVAAAEESAKEHRFRIVFHVAEGPNGQPVVDDAWLVAQLDHANRVFAPAGVRFERGSIRSLDRAHADLATRADRDALGSRLMPEVINAFIVARLADVDDVGRDRRGVHWRPAGLPGAHFVIVSAIAGRSVLAHELGHFFGNREHPEVPGNVMSYLPGEGEPSFDPMQLRRIRRFARRFERSGELVSLAW